MKELYKVRNITISVFDNNTHELSKDISCEYGLIWDREGVLFLDLHLFNEDFNYFEYDNLGCRACGKMLSFDDIVIETPYLVFTEMTTKERRITFKCLNYITVKEEDPLFCYANPTLPKLYENQLLYVHFWGLDLLIKSTKTLLMVDNHPFEVEFFKNKDNGYLSLFIPFNQTSTHNILTLELFEKFRDCLEGYLSLINGARVQITKEHYTDHKRLYSYNRIENVYCSKYACGNAKLYSPSAILYEFDNYVRWNKSLDLNVFVSHICNAEQLLDYTDRSYIFILVFEGLSNKYYDLGKRKEKILPKEKFKELRIRLKEVIQNTECITKNDIETFCKKIDNLNTINRATEKFRILLDDVNIQRNEKIKYLIGRVRSVLVHEAKLEEYTDYVLLSELIREILLRLINSKVKRYSRFETPIIQGESLDLTYKGYIANKNLEVEKVEIFPEDEKYKMLSLVKL